MDLVIAKAKQVHFILKPHQASGLNVVAQVQIVVVLQVVEGSLEFPHVSDEPDVQFGESFQASFHHGLEVVHGFLHKGSLPRVTVNYARTVGGHVLNPILLHHHSVEFSDGAIHCGLQSLSTQDQNIGGLDCSNLLVQVLLALLDVSHLVLGSSGAGTLNGVGIVDLLRVKSYGPQSFNKGGRHDCRPLLFVLFCGIAVDYHDLGLGGAGSPDTRRTGEGTKVAVMTGHQNTPWMSLLYTWQENMVWVKSPTG